MNEKNYQTESLSIYKFIVVIKSQLFSDISSKMGRKRNSALVTRSDSAKKFGGNPSPLDKTEPPTLRQVIQYSYFLQNSHPHLKDYDISKIISKDLIEIWQAVNPRLPLYEKYYVIKLIDRFCFKKAKQLNRKSLSTIQEQNIEEKLDKLFDISACTCKLPLRPCDDYAVKCKIENCQSQHIICTCPPSKKVRDFFQLPTNVI